jgi:hypothetical protein
MKNIYNFTAPIDQAEEECRRISEKLKEDDATPHAEAETDHLIYPSYIIKPVPGVQRSTEEIDGHIACASNIEIK